MKLSLVFTGALLATVVGCGEASDESPGSETTGGVAAGGTSSGGSGTSTAGTGAGVGPMTGGAGASVAGATSTGGASANGGAVNAGDTQRGCENCSRDMALHGSRLLDDQFTVAMGRCPSSRCTSSSTAQDFEC